MNEHQATIHKLVKQCAKPYLEWNCFAIKVMEENIGKFYEISFHKKFALSCFTHFCYYKLIIEIYDLQKIIIGE